MREHLHRQSFLGPGSDETIREACAAIVGLCGGGSHVAQQLAHIGLGRLKLMDHDHSDKTNRNRMVTLTAGDAEQRALKTDVVRRAVLAVNPDALVDVFPSRWQECHAELRACTTIFGCVDSFSQRSQLEAYARRYMIPYIDVGMDVTGEPGNYFVTGQVIMSLPGHACMRCMGFLTEDLLAQEAEQYGAAGGKPQVVWPNGTLASVAVGNFMSILTPWNTHIQPPLYMEYDGNRMLVTPSNRLAVLKGTHCEHFSDAESLGDLRWR